jgi:predicted lipoprotein with Yx(FWY)xxD motif
MNAGGVVPPSQTWRRTALAALVVSAALGLVACGGDSGDDSSSGVSPTTTGQQASQPEADQPDTSAQTNGAADTGGKAGGKGIRIETGDSQFGEVLFDQDDRAIYLFDKEATAESECYGACAAAWPPVLTEGDPRTGGDVRAGLLGTTERRDGSTQVTYDGRPLYYYVDEPPGQVLCHNVDEFGGLWLVVEPDGTPVS